VERLSYVKLSYLKNHCKKPFQRKKICDKDLVQKVYEMFSQKYSFSKMLVKFLIKPFLKKLCFQLKKYFN